MSAAAKQFVLQTIQEHPVVIFSKSYCPFCKMAKGIFNELQAPYYAVEIENRPDGAEIQDVLGEMTGASTVPRVFVNQECLGGATDLKEMHASNKLQPLLRNSGLLN